MHVMSSVPTSRCISLYPERADENVPVDLSVSETDLDSSELIEVSN
jgi:hypothetical protein